MQEDSVAVTVSGPDHPGITAGLTAVLAERGVPLLDLQQVVVHGRLTLCLLLGLSPEGDTHDDVLKDLLFRAKELGLSLDYRAHRGAVLQPPSPRGRYAITAMADPLEARHVRLIAETLANHQANIAAIERLSDDGFVALEVRAELVGTDRALAALRHALLQVALAENVDLAIRREGLMRRGVRLVAMDMDSTLIQVEVIDELARAHGVAEQVRRLTSDAMSGQLDYAESLRRRVAMLEGLSEQTVLQVAAALPLTEGAEALVRVLKQLGCKTAVISGGFAVAARRVAERLGLDHAHSNRLEVVDGRLTGRVLPPVVTPERKVALLEQIAAEEGVPLEQTLAIGDGANDLLMIERAGLGVAFHPKPTLREAADTTLSAGGLDRVLYLLGLHARDTRAP